MRRTTCKMIGPLLTLAMIPTWLIYKLVYETVSSRPINEDPLAQSLLIIILLIEAIESARKIFECWL